MHKTINIAIFASGNGSNAENIIRYFADGHCQANVAVVVCNNPHARVLDRAMRLGVPAVVMSKGEINDKSSVIAVMEQYHIDFIVLAGFMLMVPTFLIESYRNRIINIHPSLLPKYGGRGMYGRHVHEAVHEAGEIETGITVHYVSEECDGGEIIFQASMSVAPGASVNDIECGIHSLETRHFPHVVEQVALSLRDQSQDRVFLQ